MELFLNIFLVFAFIPLILLASRIMLCFAGNQCGFNILSLGILIAVITLVANSYIFYGLYLAVLFVCGSIAAIHEFKEKKEEKPALNNRVYPRISIKKKEVYNLNDWDIHTYINFFDIDSNKYVACKIIHVFPNSTCYIQVYLDYNKTMCNAYTCKIVTKIKKEDKEKTEMSQQKIEVVSRTQVTVHQVEGIKCYVDGGEVHTLKRS